MWRGDGTNPASLVIETTITDKSSGEEVPYCTKVEVAPPRPLHERHRPEKTHLYRNSACSADILSAFLSLARWLQPEGGSRGA